MTRLLALLAAVVVVGACNQNHVDGPRVSDVPFIHGPAVNWTNDPSTGYHVELLQAVPVMAAPDAESATKLVERQEAQLLVKDIQLDDLAEFGSWPEGIKDVRC